MNKPQAVNAVLAAAMIALAPCASAARVVPGVRGSSPARVHAPGHRLPSSLGLRAALPASALAGRSAAGLAALPPALPASLPLAAAAAETPEPGKGLAAAARAEDAARALDAAPDLDAASASEARGAGQDIEDALTGAASASAGDGAVAAGAEGPSAEIVEGVARLQPKIDAMREQFSTVIVGQREMIDSLLMGVLLQEHISLEGLPGVAKTLAAETLGAIIGVEHSRIQGRPDLRPSEISGADVIEEDEKGRRTRSFERGPIFAKIVLFDEINRAQPRTQSATLSVMQERKVATRRDGQLTTPLLMLIATQNPIEQDGTYRLPEAQEDRFMFKVIVPEPNAEERLVIMRRFSGEEAAPVARQVVSEDEVREIGRLAKRVYASNEVKVYINDVIDALKEPARFGLDFQDQISQVMSTRASLMMLKAARMNAFMAGRAYVDVEDVRAVAPRVMRHRIIRKFTPRESLSTDQLIDRALSQVRIPKPGETSPAPTQEEEPAAAPAEVPAPEIAPAPAAEAPRRWSLRRLFRWGNQND